MMRHPDCPVPYRGLMARVAGRNAVFAWFVGIVSAAVVVTLLVLAAPMFPAATGWISAATGASPRAGDADADAGAAPLGCRDLYDQASWALLSTTDGSEVAASTDAPVSTATDLVAALEPSVTLTCTWRSDAGEISTTVATVPTDAGAIAAASLPDVGFDCAEDEGRTRCARTDSDLIETIEAGAGLWLSTSQQTWHPQGYAEGVADAVWSLED